MNLNIGQARTISRLGARRQEKPRPEPVDIMADHRDQQAGGDGADHRRGEAGGLRQVQGAHRVDRRVDQQHIGADGRQRDQRPAGRGPPRRCLPIDVAERRGGGHGCGGARGLGDAGAQDVAYRADQQSEQKGTRQPQASSSSRAEAQRHQVPTARPRDEQRGRCVDPAYVESGAAGWGVLAHEGGGVAHFPAGGEALQQPRRISNRGAATPICA